MLATSREVPGAPVPVILVVDPDWDTRKILRTLLESVHYRVLDAADGGEGVRLLIRHRPDLLVTEHPVLLPTGETFLRAAIHTGGMSQGRIVVHTAHVLPEDLAEVRESGCTHVVLKPSDLERTLAAIQLALHSDVDRGRTAGACPDPFARAGRALPPRPASCPHTG